MRRNGANLLDDKYAVSIVDCWISINTFSTSVYAEIDLETKTRALAACETDQRRRRQRKNWKDDRSLLAFLNSL